MKGKYYWQGEEVRIIWGMSKVSESIENPLMWYNYECRSVDEFGVLRRGDAFIESVKVIYGNDEFVISNHFGIGIHKLKNGGGPNYTHFSLPLYGFIESNCEDATIEFDLTSYEKHEANRNAWQKKHFPKEFEVKEEMLKMFSKS